MASGRHAGAYRFFSVGLLCFAVAAAAYATLQMTFGRRPVEIHVRWAPDVDDSRRQVAERRYGLSQGALLEGRTWRYTLSDLSRTNISALVGDAVVEDTQDIDRSTFRVSPAAPSRPYLTSHPWIPVSLRGVAVLGVIVGLISIGFGLVERALPGTAKKATVAITTNATIRRRLTLLFVVTVMGICFLAARTMGSRADERPHLAQINRLIAGDYVTRTGTVGGFHATAAVFAYLTGRSDKENIRLFVLLISGTTILVFRSLMRAFEPQASTMRTIQFVFLPLLFPFWFLIYTDIYALMFLLLAVLTLTRDRVHVTGALMILSMMVRQTNIVWFAMMGLWTVIVNAAEPLRQLVRRVTSFAIGAGLFVLFVWVNGGIAVAEQDNHPDLEFQTENLLFMLICFSGMFLPLIISKLPQIARLHPVLLVGVLLSSVMLYFGTFQVDHPWNSPTDDFYLRNRILEAMTSSTVAGGVASLAIALAVLSLCVIRLRQPIHYLIYPFAALSVIPIWLIEQRYYLPAFTLFMLFRESASPRIEGAVVAVNGVVSLCLLVGIQRGWFFL